MNLAKPQSQKKVSSFLEPFTVPLANKDFIKQWFAANGCEKEIPVNPVSDA